MVTVSHETTYSTTDPPDGGLPSTLPGTLPGAPNGTTAPDSDYRVIDVSGLVNRIWSRRFVILGCSILGALLGIALALITHPQFDAVVRLMPPDHKESLIASLSPARNDGDLYLGILGSRTVADDVIAHQHLAEYFHLSKPSELRSTLAAIAKITVDKDQFVTVTVRTREPETSMRIANEFPDALYRLNHSIAVSQALHRWEYFEGPLEQEKNKLADAEEQLKIAEQKTGIVAPDAQVQLGLAAIATLKQQITTLEGQLAALETSSTNQNPQVVELRSQIGSLNGQLRRLETQNGGSGASSANSPIPSLTLQIGRLTREVKYHEALFGVLSRQYENARVEDSYSPPVELVDRAVLADQKSFPPRKQWALIGLLLGAFLGLAYAGLRR